MLNKIRDYLDFAGLQYRNPDKAGEEREKMMAFRYKGQEARKAFTELAKAFQASHPEWQLQQTSQWMNQAQRLRPHFWAYIQREGKVTEPMLALVCMEVLLILEFHLKLVLSNVRRMSKLWRNKPRY